jgi:undecaprenyl-diphosphatase
MELDLALLLKAAIMGVVEGFTEFLPISSTGHLILAGSLLDFTGEQAGTFEIAIQAGAMLAVVIEYRRRLFGALFGVFTQPAAQRFALNVAIAFTPAVVLALLFSDMISAVLFHPVPVAIAFIVGGFIILYVEHRHRRLYGDRDLLGGRVARVETVDDMTWKDALKIGLVQCAALIPGTSRSGATIIGGMIFGLSRQAATEFSFFLAVPTLLGAAGYSLYKQRDMLSMDDLPVYGVGTLFAFISAFLCIRWLIRFISTHDFVPFAWYRIVFGVIVLATFQTGWLTWHA